MAEGKLTEKVLMVNIDVGKLCLRIFHLKLSEHVHVDAGSGVFTCARCESTTPTAPLRPVSAIYSPPLEMLRSAQVAGVR